MYELEVFGALFDDGDLDGHGGLCVEEIDRISNP